MVDYEYYTGTYRGGLIPADDWPGYEAQAEAQLKRYRRIYTVTVPEYEPEGEQKAVCAMAEALQSFDLLANGEGGPVQSASIGSVSTSYGGMGSGAIDLSPAGRDRELYRCARLYLDIYRGVG